VQWISFQTEAALLDTLESLRRVRANFMFTFNYSKFFMRYSGESVIHLAIIEWVQNVLVALYYQCIVCRMMKLIKVYWRAEE
jgi:hypothetical protein